MNLSIALGLGARSVVGGVPAVPSGLELGAESLKFQPGNLQVAGQTSVLKQSTTGITNLLTDDGSCILVLYYYDPDRMDVRNNLFQMMGSGGANLAGRFQDTFVPEGINSTGAANRSRHVLAMRRTSGSTYSVQSGLQPRVRGWYWKVWKRTTGGVVQGDIWSAASGVKVGDGSAVALTQPLFGLNAFNQTHFYIGDAVDVASEATTATARGTNNNSAPGWEGGIAFVGFADVAPTDVDMGAIALGADPIARLGASNFRAFARRFGMDASGNVTGLSPISGTADTSSAATVIGTFLPGGTPGRQDTTDYITLDPVADYRVFGVDPVTLAPGGTPTASVLFSGNCGGVPFSGTISAPGLATFRHRREVRFFGGQVQGRFIHEDGTPVAAWQTVAATAAAGVTTGRTFTENARSAPGIDDLNHGQSQGAIWTTNGTTLGTPASEPIVSVVRQEQGTNNATLFAFQTRPEVGNLRVADGPLEYAKLLHAHTGCVVRIVDNSLGGSSTLDMIDDWSRTASGVTLDTEDLLAYAEGADQITVDIYMGPTSSHQAEGSNFGVNILDPLYRNAGPNATGRKLDDIRNAAAKVVIMPFTRQTPTVAGPLDADPNQAIGASRASMREWATLYADAVTPELTDMKVSPIDGPHQEPTSIRGNIRISIRRFEGVMRAFGRSTSVDPTIGTPVFASGKASFSLNATLPNAGSTLRVDDTATFGSDVQGFEISTDSGATWSRSGFTATFSGTTVTVTKSSGDWSAVAAGAMRVRYATGSPFGYGTTVEPSDLIRGGLYDGTALEGGIGLPVVPLGPTVVAEP